MLAALQASVPVVHATARALLHGHARLELAAVRRAAVAAPERPGLDAAPLAGVAVGPGRHLAPQPRCRSSLVAGRTDVTRKAKAMKHAQDEEAQRSLKFARC